MYDTADSAFAEDVEDTPVNHGCTVYSLCAWITTLLPDVESMPDF